MGCSGYNQQSGISNQKERIIMEYNNLVNDVFFRENMKKKHGDIANQPYIMDYMMEHNRI